MEMYKGANKVIKIRWVFQKFIKCFVEAENKKDNK